jgi:hypothetical protein
MSEASLSFTIASLSSGLRTQRTEYICGQNTRSESRSCTGHSATTEPADVQYQYGPLCAYIRNRDIGYGFEMDLTARIYSAFRANPNGSPVWLKPRQARALKRSGKTVHIHTETIDTGERQKIFGYSARHVLTRIRQVRESQLLSESESDGWYIDPPAAWLTLHAKMTGRYHVCSLIEGDRDDYKFTETGKPETGFTVRATRIHKSHFCDRDGNTRIHETVSHEEAIEFSEAPLPPEIFVPPPNFRRVPQLSNGMRYSMLRRTRFRWEMLKDSFSLQRKIAQFTHGPSR